MMEWQYAFTTTEGLFIGIFCLLYLRFLYRGYRSAHLLDSAPIRFWIKVPLRIITLILVLLAILGPLFGTQQKEIKSEAKEIFFCIDLSQSMNANDIQPSRLTKLKLELQNIVQALNANRMGIIMFSNEAFMQCPLTYDLSALKLFIQTLHTSLVPNSGTNFEAPLHMALERFEKNRKQHNNPAVQIIVLVSDGEDFGDNADETLLDLKKKGIKLFTLGVGTQKGSKIPTARGPKRDRQNNPIHTRLDSKTLRKLAANTQGQYFELSDTQNDIPQLLYAVDAIKGTLQDTKTLDASLNKYRYFLWLALLLLIIDYLWNIRTLKIV